MLGTFGGGESDGDERVEVVEQGLEVMKDFLFWITARGVHEMWFRYMTYDWF